MRKRIYILFLLNITFSGYIYSQDKIDTTVAGKVKWKAMNPATKLWEKGSFIDGKRHGTWEYRNEEGSVVLREKYRNGKYISSVYYKNGKIIMLKDNKGKVVKRPDCGC